MTATGPGVPPWTDSHCHVHDEEDPAPVLARAAAAGVRRLVAIGTTAQSSRAALALCAAHIDDSPVAMFATIGLHPHEATSDVEEIAALVASAAPPPGPRHPGSVVAVGECGLDYFYEHSPRDAQRRVFARQIALAKAHDLTLVVHTRDAWDDTFDLLASEGVPARTVIHCFTGGVDEARRCLALGAYVSLSGILTFKSAEHVREAARYCPLDALLVETDSPYLTPVPLRGRPNEPAHVTLVGAALAGLKDLGIEEVAARTTANAAAAFAIAAT